MYTKAFYKGADEEGGRNRLIVVFTGDGEKDEVVNFYPGGTVTDGWLRDRAIETIAALNTLRSLKSKLSVGEIDLTPGGPPDETQEDKDRKEFLGMLEVLRQAANPFGLDTGADVAGVKASAQALLDTYPKFVEFVGR